MKVHFLYCLAVILKGINAISVGLAPIKAKVFQNESLKLNCSVSENVTYVKWVSSAVNGWASIGFNNGRCSANLFLNDSLLYGWSCQSRSFSLTIKRVTLSQHDEQWYCYVGSGDNRSNNSTIYVQVRVSSVILDIPSGSTSVTVAENKTINFSCTTSKCRPAPEVTWYIDGDTADADDDVSISEVVSQSPAAGSDSYVSTNGSLTYKPSRAVNGKYVFCKSSDDDGYTVLSNRKVLLSVTYKPNRGPLIQNFSNNTIYYAIEDREQKLTCSVIGGNPLASLSWSCFNGNGSNLSSGQNVSNGLTWKTSRNGICMCISKHLDVAQSVILNVRTLAPPTSPVFLLNSQTVQGSITVKIIRDSSAPINCSARSSPSPDKYTWKYDRQSTALSQVALLYPSKIIADGRYLCEVGNTMTPSQGQVEHGSSSAYITIQRLYAPSVNQFNVGSLVEESTLSVECKTRPGNPVRTTYTWKRKFNSSSDNTWRNISGFYINGNQLRKTNINRNDTGTYKCTASNVMIPTAEHQKIGSDSKTFFLNVLYKTSISSFIEINHTATQQVTVSENSSVTLHCQVDSNPASTIRILKDGETKISQENTKEISYLLSKVACSTAGRYRCVGFNKYNTENSKPLKDLQLFVTCSPRLPSSEDFVSNITSALNDEAQLKITVVAYPVPEESEYVWSKWNGVDWETLIHDDNVKINTSGLESSLIVQNVEVSDYQKYRVNVKNSFGQLQQEFFLNPYGKPNPPENVNVMDGSLRETSAKITWTPGFNGGPEQTFVVQYKKQGESTWLEVTKEDEGTDSTNVSLTGLVRGTSYTFRMYSKNIKGNSSFTDILTFQTLEKTETTSAAALIVGATGGSVVFIILLIGVVVFFVRRSSFKKGKSKASNEGNDRKPVYEEEDDYGMKDNPMYVSAGPRQSTSKAEESSAGGAAVYSTVNKTTKAIDNDNEYAVVNKTNKAKAKPGKKEKEKRKQGFFKDKKGKKLVQEGDIYENAPSKDLKAVPAKDETIYENPESSMSTQKKNVNKDGLIYADLTFNDHPKGQKKLVIHGLDSMTEYVQVDFTKKADPLPDSDDENLPPKN